MRPEWNAAAVDVVVVGVDEVGMGCEVVVGWVVPALDEAVLVLAALLPDGVPPDGLDGVLPMMQRPLCRDGSRYARRVK